MASEIIFNPTKQFLENLAYRPRKRTSLQPLHDAEALAAKDKSQKSKFDGEETRNFQIRDFRKINSFQRCKPFSPETGLAYCRASAVGPGPQSCVALLRVDKKSQKRKKDIVL